MSITVDRVSLRNQLASLGIEEGDTLLIKANLMQIGLMTEEQGRLLIDAFLDVVGSSGTILSSGFTPSWYFWKRSRKNVFTKSSHPITGSFSKLMLLNPSVIRSRHPTNSFIGIGDKADYILSDHDAAQSSFFPVSKLIELDGKCITLGCVFTNPGFTTFHWAQHVLGYSTKSILRNRVGTYYLDDGQVKWFSRKDFGGCSFGMVKLYQYYEKSRALKFGPVGYTNAVIASAKKTFKMDLKMLKKSPTVAFCDNDSCFSCRGSWYYNVSDMPSYYVRNAFRIASRLFD